MLVPAAVALRREKFDRRTIAALYGLVAGLTGAGGQLLLFQALSDDPAYLIFPVVSLSPGGHRPDGRGPAPGANEDVVPQGSPLVITARTSPIQLEYPPSGIARS